MLKANISKKIGDVEYSFQVEEERGKNLLANASFFGDIPSKCGVCGSENVHLNMNKAKAKDGSGEYTYLKVICKDCNARSQLGEYKSGGYFWKNWEEYKIPSKSSDSYNTDNNEEDDYDNEESENSEDTDKIPF